MEIARAIGLAMVYFGTAGVILCLAAALIIAAIKTLQGK